MRQSPGRSATSPTSSPPVHHSASSESRAAPLAAKDRVGACCLDLQPNISQHQLTTADASTRLMILRHIPISEISGRQDQVGFVLHPIKPHASTACDPSIHLVHFVAVLPRRSDDALLGATSGHTSSRHRSTAWHYQASSTWFVLHALRTAASLCPGHRLRHRISTLCISPLHLQIDPPRDEACRVSDALTSWDLTSDSTCWCALHAQ